MYQTFSTIAVSIFLEGLFFLLIGVLISSIIDIFVSAETLNRLIPNNKYLALVSTSLLGIIFPICECGIVPVIHRLLKKGVPLHLCITLLFSAPIVNIVVISSTYFAFQNQLIVVILRVVGGFSISLITGLIVSFTITEKDVVKEQIEPVTNCSCCSHDHSTVKIKKIAQIGTHSIIEFFDTVKYFILGILITALIQTLIPRSIFNNLSSHFPLSNIFMMFLPYVLSVCSNTDAFIARSFIDQFDISSLLCFMVFGAMFDIKSTLMLNKIFKKRFIIRLIIIVMLLTLLFSLIVKIFLDRSIL